MAFVNRYEADISPKKTKIDPKAYATYIDIPMSVNTETGQIYSFRAYVAVPKMQKKVNFKPTILLTLTFFKYKFHLQTREFEMLNTAFRKLSSWIDSQEKPLTTHLSKELDAHDLWEAEYLANRIERIIPLKT
jgi:hypothetical protein